MRLIVVPDFGQGWIAYEAAKRWILVNFADVTAAEFQLACRLAAERAGV